MAGRFIDATLRFIDNFTGPMNQATRRMEESARTYQRAGKQIQAAGNGIANVGKTLTTTITTPIVGLGVAAVKTAADFETSMDRVAAVMGEGVTQHQLELLTMKAQEMGAKTKYSASDSAEAFELLAQAGWNASKMMENIEGMMYLAGATGATLADSASYVVSAMAGLGEKSGYTADIIGNNLAKAANSSKTNINAMGEAFSMVATTVGQSNYTMEDACVILGTLANANVEGSEAGMAFNRILERMGTNSSAIEQLKALGVAMYDSEGNARDLTDLFEDLRAAYAGLGSDAERTNVTKALGGQYSTKLKAILGAEQSAWDGLKESMRDTTGACQEMYETANDNLSGQLTIIKSTIESIAITFGKKLLPYVRQGADKIQELADKVNNLNDAQVSNIIKWAGIAAAIGPAILVFGKVVIGIGKVVSVIGKMGAAINAAGGVVALFTGPAGIVIGVVAALAAVAVLVYKNWDKVKEFFVSFGKNFVSVFNSSGETVNGFGERFNALQDKFQIFLGKAKELWVVLEPGVRQLGEVFKFVFEVGIAGAIGYVAGAFNSILNTVVNVADHMMTYLGGLAEFFTGIFTGDMEKAINGLQDVFSGGFGMLVEIVKAPINGVIGAINGMVTQINKVGVKIPDWVPNMGGKEFKVNIPALTYLYKGTNNWGGGPAMIHDRGAEIVDLPKGTRVYPHDKSLQMARAEGSKSVVVNIPKLADSIVIREDADIERLMDAFARKLDEVAPNMA